MSDGSTAAEAGLAWLLGGGVAEAAAAVEGTLATVQSAATRALAGLSQMRAAGVAMAAVPPVARAAAAPADNEPGTTVTGAASARAVPLLPQPVVHVSEGGAPVAAFAPGAAPAGAAVAPVEAASVTKNGVAVTFAAFAPAAPPVSVAAATMAAADAQPAVAVPARATAAAMPAAPMPGAGAEAAPPRAYAPPANARTGSGPTGGDVFLDGARVGTWIAEHLAREVERPQTGATGFDPRMSPAWPGTLQGG